MNISEAIEQQILALLKVTDPPVDLKPITDRLAILEAKPAVPNLSIEVATLDQALKILSTRISGIDTKLTSTNQKVSDVEQSVNNLLVESVNPPDDSNWRAWLHREVANGKVALTYYVRSLVDGAAIAIWRDPDYADSVVTASHSNAVAISDTEVRQNLIAGLSLIYTPKRDVNGQVGIRLFTTAGTFTSITATGIDAQGVLVAGWSRNLTDITGEVNQISPPAQITKLLITFVRPDQTSVIYEFPLS